VDLGEDRSSIAIRIDRPRLVNESAVDSRDSDPPAQDRRCGHEWGNRICEAAYVVMR